MSNIIEYSHTNTINLTEKLFIT